MKVAGGEQAVLFKENEDLYKRMNKSLEKKIHSKEDEIKELDVVYDKKMESVRQEGERQYMQGLDRNQLRIVDESNTFEEKIQGYKDQLLKMQNTVAKEEANIKTSHKDKIGSLKHEMESSFQEDYQRLQADRQDAQMGTQDAVKRISANSKSEKLLLEDQARYEISALSSDYNQKGIDTEKDYRTKLDQGVRLHNADIAQQKDELKKLMDLDAEKSKRLGTEKTRVNKDQLDYQEKHQQDMLSQREKDFKVRYEKIVQEHNTILKELSDKLQSDVKTMVDRTSADKKIIEEKSSDPFYTVSSLAPKMVEDEKTVTISMPVAQHEKENVHLSTQGRQIKITLSRKYADNLKAEDGSLNRSTRSELFSKEFNTTDLLSSKNILQTYVDGILSFKVQKA